MTDYTFDVEVLPPVVSVEVTAGPVGVSAAQVQDVIDALDLGSASTHEATDFATSAQGSKADSAVQPGALGTAASHPASDFATASQGTKADAAVQPAALAPYLTSAVANSTFVTFLNAAKNPDSIITGAITRDANEAVTSAAVVWPDGTPGTFTADTLSTAFPGAVDGYHITYGSPVTKTYTQPTLTRDAGGAATVVPAMVVS